MNLKSVMAILVLFYAAQNLLATEHNTVIFDTASQLGICQADALFIAELRSQKRSRGLSPAEEAALAIAESMNQYGLDDFTAERFFDGMVARKQIAGKKPGKTKLKNLFRDYQKIHLANLLNFIFDDDDAAKRFLPERNADGWPAKPRDWVTAFLGARTVSVWNENVKAKVLEKVPSAIDKMNERILRKLRKHRLLFFIWRGVPTPQHMMSMEGPGSGPSFMFTTQYEIASGGPPYDRKWVQVDWQKSPHHGFLRYHEDLFNTRAHPYNAGWNSPFRNDIFRWGIRTIRQPERSAVGDFGYKTAYPARIEADAPLAQDNLIVIHLGLDTSDPLRKRFIHEEDEWVTKGRSILDILRIKTLSADYEFDVDEFMRKRMANDHFEFMEHEFFPVHFTYLENFELPYLQNIGNLLYPEPLTYSDSDFNTTQSSKRSPDPLKEFERFGVNSPLIIKNFDGGMSFEIRVGLRNRLRSLHISMLPDRSGPDLANAYFRVQVADPKGTSVDVAPTQQDWSIFVDNLSGYFVPGFTPGTKKSLEAAGIRGTELDNLRERGKIFIENGVPHLRHHEKIPFYRLREGSFKERTDASEDHSNAISERIKTLENLLAKENYYAALSPNERHQHIVTSALYACEELIGQWRFAGRGCGLKMNTAEDVSRQLHLFGFSFNQSQRETWSRLMHRFNSVRILSDLSEPEISEMLSTVKDDVAEFKRHWAFFNIKMMKDLFNRIAERDQQRRQREIEELYGPPDDMKHQAPQDPPKQATSCTIL